MKANTTIKQLIHTALLTTLLLSLCYFGQAQQQSASQAIYFNSGRYKLSADQQQKIEAINYKSGSFFIIITGHTDNKGDYSTNKKLSEKRADAVKLFLIKRGIDPYDIEVRSFGPDSPLVSNSTAKGRQFNRRVMIETEEFQLKIDRIPKPVSDISELYAQIQTPLQSFCINRSRDTAIRCRKGTVIYIKANSLVATSPCKDACITFRVKEAFLKSDMILDNLTTTSNGELIESQGMLYTEAVDCNGKRIVLQPGKDLIIMIPADTIRADAKIFDGNRGHDSIMNWTVNNNSVLSNFTLPQLDLCNSWINCKNITADCEPCRFLFCRVARIGKAIKGTFNKPQHFSNKAFRQCQKDLMIVKNSSAADVVSGNPAVIKVRPLIDSSLKPKCQQMEEMFKKYGVTDLPSLYTAINKQMLDSFKVSTMEELADTLAKINTQKIELSYLSKKLSFDDFKFYVYNSPKLGWSNVDCFSNIPERKKITLSINLQPAANIDCKLVFRKRRSVMPAAKEGDHYEFKGIPKNEEAFIVAVKYKDGSPSLAIKAITTSNALFDVEFKELTLDELKAQLKQLDQ
jgi:hypothetical protein